MKDNVFIKNINFREDYRTFKKGESIEFNTPFIALVGVNGCGKSTILDCLRQEFGIKDKSYLKKDCDKGVFDIEMYKTDFEKKYYDFHSNDMKYSSVFGDDMMGQVQSMSASSGISSLIQFGNTKIKESKNSVILLDEPDRGMALKIQNNLAQLFVTMMLMGNNQLIISTHSTYIMKMAETYGQIYSVEHKRFFDTVDEFIKEHLK